MNFGLIGFTLLNYIEYIIAKSQSPHHDRILEENTGHIIGTGDIMTPVNEMTPVENTQNHVQNLDVGDTGDIFPIEGY
jgi:hypothetical protein